MGQPQLITDLSRLSINTATTKPQYDLKEAVEAYSKHGIKGISPWRDQVAKLGLSESAKIIKDHDMTVTGYCRGGFFPFLNAQQRQDNIDDNLRAIDEAAAIGAQCLVLVCGGLPGTVPGKQAGPVKDIELTRTMVKKGIEAVLKHARQAGVPLAIEPLHPMYAADRSVITTLQEANDLCDALGEGVGIAIDVYHVWWDPNLVREIKRAGQHKNRILAFHICDFLVPTTDLLLDRGMMGDGVIDIPSIRALVEEQGYTGFHEVEIFSQNNWWKKGGLEVLEACKMTYLSAV
jgi:sugar phosphate isomerase/epimerase